jgi:hypothetical protein
MTDLSMTEKKESKNNRRKTVRFDDDHIDSNPKLECLNYGLNEENTQISSTMKFLLNNFRKEIVLRFSNEEKNG